MLGRHPAIDSISREGDLLVFHSADGGRRWPDRPLVLRRSPDHPTIAVDTSGSKWRRSVYVMSGQSIRVSSSRDGGRTFAPAVRVTPNNLINLAEKPVVLSNGTLVLSFVDAGWRRDSTDRLGFFRYRRSWIVRSSDGGESFSTPFFVTDACGQPPHFQQSFLAVDPSAAFRDRLYFACRRAGGGPIVVAHSSDPGSRWSDPVPVSTEADDSTVARVVAMTVNPNGVLGSRGWWAARQSPVTSFSSPRRWMVVAPFFGPSGYPLRPALPLPGRPAETTSACRRHPAACFICCGASPPRRMEFWFMRQ